MKSDDAPLLNSAELDGINLTQALIDVEIANARVIDLTRRLTEFNKQLGQARHAAEVAQIELAQANARLHTIHQSRTFRALQNINAARRLLKL
jgi:outer membrane murein-binding lipoprotein Lpp